MVMPGMSVHRDRPLTNRVWSLMQRQPPVALRATNVVYTPHASDQYYLFDPQHSFRDTVHAFEFNTSPPLSPWALSDDQFHVELESVDEILSFKDAQNADQGLAIENHIVRSISNKLSIALEREFAETLMPSTATDAQAAWTATANYQIGRPFSSAAGAANIANNSHYADFWNGGASLPASGTPWNSGGKPSNGDAGLGNVNVLAASGATGWWDSRNNDSTLMDDVQNILAFVSERSAYRPNVMVMNQRTYNKMVLNGNLTERFKYTETGLPPTSTLAGWLGVEQILISGIIRNSAGSGFTGHYVIPNGHVLFMYVPQQTGLEQATCAETFVWSGYFSDSFSGIDSVGSTIGVRRYRHDFHEAYYFRAYKPTDIKLVAPLMGFLLMNVMRNP